MARSLISKRIKPGISVNKKIWEEFREKAPNASDTLEKIMANYQKPTSSETSIVQIDKDVWQSFKNKYQDIAIQELERLLQLAVSSPSASATVMSVNTAFVNSVSIPSANNWAVNYSSSSNSINLTQITNTTAITSTTSYNASGATTSTSDILIDFNGDIK